MEDSGLTTFALIFMLISMGSVTALAAYCYYRILWGSKKSGSGEESQDHSSPPLVM